MTEEIVKYEAGGELVAFNGKKAQSSDEQIVIALAPIFAAFPHFEAKDDWLLLYKMMLRDIEPGTLKLAVLRALAVCEYVPSIAAIRKAAGVGENPPGEHEKVDASKLKPVPSKMYRLSPEEDERQRRAQLKRTKKWDYA